MFCSKTSNEKTKYAHERSFWLIEVFLTIPASLLGKYGETFGNQKCIDSLSNEQCNDLNQLLSKT